MPTPMRTFIGRSPVGRRPSAVIRLQRRSVEPVDGGERLDRLPAQPGGLVDRVPRASTPATTTVSGTPSSALTAASSRTTMVVITPASPSARAASRMLQANG